MVRRWRRSAPRSSRSGRGRPSSRSTGCAGSTAATAPGCWRRRGGRSATGRGSGVGADPAWPPTPLPERRGGAAARRCRPRGCSALPRARCRSRSCATGSRRRSARPRSWSSRCERLGIETLGALARHLRRPGRRPLRPARPARRCGSPAARTSRCARAARTRSWPSRSSCRKGPPGASSIAPWSCWSTACWRRPQRRGRTLLGLRLGALLAGGGSWSVEQGLGRPSASARVLRTVLAPRLEALPGPATALRLRALGLGPPAADQLELAVGGEEPRRRRLGAAVREVRAAQGAEALLRILPVDPASRVPERWAVLTPFPEL